MSNIATSYLSLLQEDDIQLKSIALEKLNLLIENHWSEISDSLKLFKEYYEKKIVPDKEKLICLILSKLYYNLEDYESAVEWGLKSEELLDVTEQSLYVKTILKKMLDKYIEIKKFNFFHREKENEKPIDKRILLIIDNVFNECLKDNRIFQAIGFCVESYDLDRLTNAIDKTNDKMKNLNFIYDIAENFVTNKEYKKFLIDLLFKLLIKYAKNEYMKITSCQFLLDNSDALANTLLNILEEKDNLIAYQIAFDLYDNQNPNYLSSLIDKINAITNEDKKKHLGEKLTKLIDILNGEISRNVIMKTLKKLNQSNLKTLEDLRKAVEKGTTLESLGVLITNSLFNSHTSNDEFLRKNMEWISKVTNWARFIAAASLGVVHMGDTKNGQTILKDYLPGGSQSKSMYSIGGAFYGLGLINAGTNNEKVKEFLCESLGKPNNNKEPIQHGLYLGIGLVAMGSRDRNLYERLRDGIYTDDAIIGEAAGYAIGLVMCGSKDEQAIDDLLKYVHDTQHEKIIRAIAIALSLIVYNTGEYADALIEQLCREKDPILRYGAMYCIGMAYCGTGNNEMLQKLIKFSVTDVSDDVRRAALINIGFLEIRTPDVLFNNLQVLSLLSESYNSHVRYGAAMAIGIVSAGSGKKEPYKIIEPLFTDPNYLVRQAALIASGLIFSQTTTKQEEACKTYIENLDKIIFDKDEHLLIKFGGFISKGLLELGGKNCSINLVSNTNENKMRAIIGMCLFTQYYYWFPMIHMLNLSVNPSILFNIDENMKLPLNYKIKSKAKPSVFGYPKEEDKEKKKKETKVEAAVLSTHARVKAKERKTNTLTLTEMKSGNLIYSSDVKQSEEKKDEKKEKKNEEKKDEKKDDKKEDEIKIDTSKIEPEEEELVNPMKILPLQKPVISEIKNQDYEPIIHNRLNGFVLIQKTREDVVPQYEKDENITNEEQKQDQNNNTNSNNNDMKTPENKKSDNNNNKDNSKIDLKEDYDIPEDFDVDTAK